MMPTRLVVLTLLLAVSGSAPVRAADPKGLPPTPPSPGPPPQGAAAHGTDSFCLTGGCLVWPLAGSWYGVVWRDSDCSVLLSVCREPVTGAPQITEECILLKTDAYYCSLLNGGLGGIRHAWYLGGGCIAELDVGIAPGRSRISIHRNPSYWVMLTIRYDLLGGQWSCGWELG